MINSRSHLNDDPLMHMLQTARENNTPSAKYIDSVLENTTSSFITKDLQDMKEQIMLKEGSKFKMYCILNPDLNSHPIYHSAVTEHHRIAFSRFRTSSHRLKIETGRWSRIKKEDRICNCGLEEVQDEIHVIETCRSLVDLRESFKEVITFTVKEFQECDYSATAEYLFEALEILN